MDFGDATHLALSAADDGFRAFDRELGKVTTDIGAMPAVKFL